MRVIQDDIWLCSDCTQVACNGVYGTELTDEKATLAGLARLESDPKTAVVPDFDSETGDGITEFSSVPCEACGTHLAGYRAKFAILGEEK